MAFCLCGSEIAESAKFCTQCGKTYASTSRRRNQRVVYGKYSARAVCRAERGSARKSRKKKSKAPLVIGIIAGVLCSAVLWWLIGRTLFAPYRQSRSLSIHSPEYHCTDLVLERRLVWLVDNRIRNRRLQRPCNSWWDACAQIDLASGRKRNAYPAMGRFLRGRSNYRGRTGSGRF